MHRSLIAVALLLLAPLATAQVYKWTDASGTVHYSQDAPPEGTKFSKVTTTGTVQPPAPAQAGSAAPTPAAAPVRTASTPENRSQICTSLKANLDALQGNGPVVMQQDGKATPLDTAQRKQQLDATQGQYNQYCQTQ